MTTEHGLDTLAAIREAAADELVTDARLGKLVRRRLAELERPKPTADVAPSNVIPILEGAARLVAAEPSVTRAQALRLRFARAVLEGGGEILATE